MQKKRNAKNSSGVGVARAEMASRLTTIACVIVGDACNK